MNEPDTAAPRITVDQAIDEALRRERAELMALMKRACLEALAEAGTARKPPARCPR